MSTFQIAAVAASDVTEATLNAAPARALRFLQGAGEPNIRGALATVGWNQARIDEAWKLLMALKGNSVLAVPTTDPVADAVAACEAWQATGLVCARARLNLSFPEQAAFLFENFVAGKGMAAVLNVSMFLGRRHDLVSGVRRKATRKVDHEALALLQVAGVTKEEVARLAGLVDTAQNVSSPKVGDDEAKRIDAARLDALRKIYAWLNAWGDIARTVITRRDQLIRLGLAKRRSPKAKTTPVLPPAVPVALPMLPAPPAMAPVDEELAPESRAA